ncbi:MAG: outer membrane beta-barrel protein [Deltaproteobacteria bacterium]|nr:outer membrane beta-barrel protein [Deltaproteobacteria bacterium]MBZ0219906.1 outer membrane beta-barrel protein [Deltaproteobacteria bacterium]
MLRKPFSLITPFIAILLFTVLSASSVSAAELLNQVFFRFGKARLSDDRGGEVFTDTLNVFGEGRNDGTSGTSISAGLDLALARDFGPGTLLGEIMLDYSRFSEKRVTQTTTTLLELDGVGTHNTKEVTVSELIVAIAPKYRFDRIGSGKVRPWIIPAGIAFMVNSPPSDDTTYLDIGYHLGAGIEYVINGLLSVGADFRHTIASGDPGIKASYSTAAVYLGINF